jgi:dTMP kinase
MKAIFISLEGPEGAGKSSVLAALAPELSKYRKVLATREPGGARIAEEIREIILNPENHELDGKSEMLLFAAARRVHLLQKIKPALDRGELVLVDRFIDSSVAYQGGAAGLGTEDVKWLNDFATDGLKPDLTLYFDLAPEIGLARVMENREREKNRLDLADLDYHKRVVAAYQILMADEPTRFLRINAAQPFQKVVADTLSALAARFPDDFSDLGAANGNF